MRLLVSALILSALTAWAAAAGTISDPTHVDVCAKVPGADVAATLNKTLKKVRPMTTESTSRCVYLLARPDRPDESVPGVVLWLYRAEDYDELTKHTQGTIEKVQGLGDAAIRFEDPGDGLFKLRVLSRGHFALEAVAADPESSHKLAELALARLSK